MITTGVERPAFSSPSKASRASQRRSQVHTEFEMVGAAKGRKVWLMA
jgi:hypothetical protein